MATVGSVVIGVKANTAKAESSLVQFRKKAGALAAGGFGINSLMKSAVGLAAGFVGVRTVLGEITRADAIGKLSAKTGFSTKLISSLEHAGSLADVTFGQLSSSLLTFTRNIGKSGNGLDLVGLKMSDLKGLTMDETLAKVADGFAKIDDPARRIAVAAELGKMGFADLIPLLGDGAAGLKLFGTEAEKAGRIVDGKTAASAEKFNDALTRVHTAGLRLAAGVGRIMAPTLTMAAMVIENVTNSVADLGDWFGISTGKTLFFVGAIGGILLAIPKLLRGIKAVVTGVKVMSMAFNNASPWLKAFSAAAVVIAPFALAAGFDALADSIPDFDEMIPSVLKAPTLDGQSLADFEKGMGKINRLAAPPGALQRGTVGAFSQFNENQREQSAAAQAAANAKAQVNEQKKTNGKLSTLINETQRMREELERGGIGLEVLV